VRPAADGGRSSSLAREQSVTQANFYYEKFAPSGVLAMINEAPK
jgi:hypothetical protein